MNQIELKKIIPFPNVIGHDVSNTGANESKFNDERIDKRRRTLDQVSQYILTMFVANL